MSKEGENHKELLEELRRITKILILIAIEGKTQKEKIAILDSLGLAPKNIAEVIGTTPGTVRTTLSKNRKKSKRSTK